jgi:hypothetical protein
MGLISRLLAVAIVGCSLTSAVLAQQEEITVDSKPTDAEIRGWLTQEDPRIVAWGAYFAREGGGDGAVTLLLRQVDRWSAGLQGQPEGSSERRDGMSAVLDALIQRREVVAEEKIGALAGAFPVQAVILASRLPITDAAPLLMGWYGDGESRGYSPLPRMAAMMLAKAPPPGFAGSVLAQRRFPSRFATILRGLVVVAGAGPAAIVWVRDLPFAGRLFFGMGWKRTTWLQSVTGLERPWWLRREVTGSRIAAAGRTRAPGRAIFHVY